MFPCKAHIAECDAEAWDGESTPPGLVEEWGGGPVWGQFLQRKNGKVISPIPWAWIRTGLQPGIVLLRKGDIVLYVDGRPMMAMKPEQFHTFFDKVEP